MQKKKKRKHFYRGPTMSCNLYFTNTTSTSVCSPTNSWMQYTTLIYPVKNQACKDLRERSARGGRRLRFGWANLTVVGRESHGNGTALFFQPYKFAHCEAATTVGNSRSFQWFHTIVLILRKKNTKKAKSKTNQLCISVSWV